MDVFRVNSGTDNIIKGGENTQKNTIYNLGQNTSYDNCIDITPRPYNASIQVGAEKDEFITETIQFMLGDFWLDFSTSQTAKESIEKLITS